MKYLLLILVLINLSCAQKVVKNKPIQEVNNVTQTDLEECQLYEKNVLKPAFNPDSNEFVKDELLARQSLSHFDVRKGLPEMKGRLITSILNDCNSEKVKEFDVNFKKLNQCNLLFSELGYLRALSVAIRDYRWPTDLKLESKKSSLDYVRYYSQGDFPLINRLIALSVLDELSLNSVVNQSLHDEIKKYMLDAKAYVEGLREKLNQDPDLTCESMLIVKEELEYSNQLATKIKGLLDRI